MGREFAEGILIPFWRAAITGILAGAVSWSIGGLWGWSRPMETALVVGSVAALLAWLRGYQPDDHPDVENLSNVGQISADTPQSVIIVPDGPNGYKRLTGLFDVIEPEQFHQLADKVYNGGLDFTLSNFAGPGALLSRGQVERLRSLLLERGFLRWKIPGAPSQGVTWTRGGVSLVKHFSELHRTPTLIDRSGNDVVTFYSQDTNHARGTRD